MDNELPVIEYGRYRLWKTPDGGWLLARAAFTCERCQECGCGDQQDQVVIPGMLVRMAEGLQRDGGGMSPVAMFRRLRRGARRGDSEQGGGDGAEAAEGDDLPGDLVDLVPAVGSSDQEGDS